jgi:type I restriction enzyme, S subunit
MLLSNLNLLATAPGGVARLRELILTLAVRGKLVPQDPKDEPASELLKKIRAEKDRLILAGKIKSDKPLEGIAEEEKPFELARGWEWQTLAEIGAWAIGSGFPHEAQGREGLPILFAKVSDMNLPGNELEIVRTNHTIDDETVERLRINLHKAGTVIFPKIGGAIATNKRRVLVRPTAIDNNCLGITPSAAMSTSYLYLLLSSIDFTVYQAGTSVPALSQGTLGQIPVGLPPLAEQSRIVTRVEELMRLCDALEAKGRLEATQHAQLVSTLLGTLTQSETPAQLAEGWQRIATHFDLLLDRPEAVDALEQTIMQLAVRGLLVPQDPQDEPTSELLKKIRAEKDKLIAEGKIKRDKPLPPIAEDEQPFALPLGWEWVRVADLCSMVTDGEHLTPTRCNDATQVPLVTAKNVRHEVMDYRVTDFVPQDVAEKCWQRCKPLVGDILMVSVGATLGRLCVLREPLDMVLVRSVTVLRPVPVGVSVDFFALHLMSQDSQSEIWREVKQSAQPCLYLAKSAALKIALPPLAEQSRIVTRVTQLRRLCFELRQRLASSQSTQAHLAEALVQQVA